MMSRASARAIKEKYDWMPTAATHAPHDSTTFEHLQPSKDADPRPTTGRNSKMGRRAEKPRDPTMAGPSGQPGRAKHDKRHANK